MNKKNFNKSNPIFLNTGFDKNLIKDLVSWFLQTYGEKSTLNFLESLKNLGFHQATLAGVSLGLDDLKIPPEKPLAITKAHIATQKIEQNIASGSLTSVEKSQCLIDTWNQTSDFLRQTAVQNFRRTNLLNPVYMMAFSGARGNVSQVRQLVGMRGLMADPQGAILEFPIQSNFREGLTITEYLISCYGARKGLVDTALRTATSGYLTRRLVDSAQQAVIAMRDCGTKRIYNLQGKNLKNRLIGRVLAESLQTKEGQFFKKNHIISKQDAIWISKNFSEIKIRSPLICEASTSVCQFCYGCNLATGKLVQLGEAVGVIAAQSIGEPGTQLTMRTFHTGGVGVFSNQALKPIYAPYKGKVVFHHALPGHFIRTPYGQIAYMVKQINSESDRTILTIEPYSKIDQIFSLRENELTAGSLIFIKHGETIESKQLLTQISYVKITKQKMPESSHPVYSTLEGQVFFENMQILIETEFDTKKNDIQSLFGSEESQTRRMKKIGSFWVLASSNQFGIRSTLHKTSFLEQGDLVSQKTVFITYNFFSSIRTQIQKIKSTLAFGKQTIKLSINKIHFYKNSYKFNSNNTQFAYLKKTSHLGKLIWYPFEQKNKLNFFPYREIRSCYFLEKHSIKALKSQGLIFTLNSFFVSSDLINKFLFKFKHKNLLSFHQINKTQKFLKIIVFNFQGNELNKIQSNNFLETIFTSTQKQSLNLKSLLIKSGWVVLYKPQSILVRTQRHFIPTGFFKKVPSFSSHRNNLKSRTKQINFCFPKRNVSMKFLSMARLESFVFNQLIELDRNWYEISNLLETEKHFTKIPPNKVFTTNTKTIKSLRKFYKSDFIWYSKNSNPIGQTLDKSAWQLSGPEVSKGDQSEKIYPQNSQSLTEIKKLKYISIGDLVLIQPLSESTIHTQTVFQKQLIKKSNKLLNQNPRNSLICKQTSTKFNPKPKLVQEIRSLYSLPKILRGQNPYQFNWISNTNLLKVHYKPIKTAEYPKIQTYFQSFSKNSSRGLSLFQYHSGAFPKPNQYSFQTTSENWVCLNTPFTSGFIKMKNSGEFLYKNQEKTGISLSVLRKNDELTLLAKHSDPIKLGNLIRWGDEIEPGKAIPYNGQVLKKTKTTLTLRLGNPFLASARGILHVTQNELVEKNDLLITLKSRQLQTEDIVQGIPKIEQLFEARESQSGEILSDTVHKRLKAAFLRELKALQNPQLEWAGAIERSFLEAQQFLVEQIVEAYENQGVKISEKHVEVIVRQMTNRVRILDPGQTGLLPGELVYHTWVQKLNKHIRNFGLLEATYEPLVLGISKSVLQSESFLLAASFQEVSRVLVRSALSKKQDFLYGLHENVIVGQTIPAGTGLISQIYNSKSIS